MIEALGSKKRLMILRSLSRGEKCVSELMNELRMDGKTAKHHLNVLEKHGIIDSELRGKRKYYRLKKEILIHVSPPPARKFVIAVVEREKKDEEFLKSE